MKDAGKVREILADANLTPAEKVGVIDRIVAPSPVATDKLWSWLVRGLLFLATTSLLGLAFAALDGNSETIVDPFVTVFTASLTGLLGLFIEPN